MRVSNFGKRAVIAVISAVTLFGGMPVSHAATPGTALCSATGNRYDSTFAVTDLNCANGSSDLTGLWHLEEHGDQVTGYGPNGRTVTGVYVANPICITVGGNVIRYCRSVRLSVCIDNSCTYVTLYICISYRVPRVQVCVWYLNYGPYDGDAVLDGTNTATPL